MRLGIDFGTTRVVVAQVDRGNFPLVSFEAPDGQMHDWFPPVVAINGEARLYGWDAIAVQEDERWTVCVRSSATCAPPIRIPKLAREVKKFRCAN